MIGVGRCCVVCSVCLRPSDDGFVHGRCRRGYYVDRLFAPFVYRGLIQKALKSVKYRGSWDVLRELVDMLWDEIGSDLKSVDDSWIVVGVPMYVRKRKDRGFNQAEKLGRMIAERLDIQYVELLIRTKETKSQYGLGRRERAKNMEGVFRVDNDVDIQDKKLSVVLVDDVLTTGVTLRECCGVLKKNGIRSVYGVCVGR